VQAGILIEERYEKPEGGTLMPEITYLPEVACDVSPGLLDTLVTVGVPDETGNRHYLEVSKGFVTWQNGQAYLPVGIVELDSRKQRALVELPAEAASGANRLWIPFSSFHAERSDA
jgi:hypothetical protein